MANHETEIYLLGQAISIFPNSSPETLTPQEQGELSSAIKLYLGYCKAVTNHDPDHRIESGGLSAIYKYKIKIVPELQAIKDFLSKPEEKEEEPAKSQKEVSSVPPEIEGLVEEYRQNQERLNEEEVKSSGQRTVAEQIKIAIEHSNRRELIIANRREREQAGEKFKDQDSTIVDLGSPKDQTVTNALAPSYSAVQHIASAYDGFKNLSPAIQKQIISQAVELNTVGITDIDVAIQAVSLQLGIKDLSSSFVSEIANEISDIDIQINETENKISKNESAIDELQTKTSLSDSETQTLNRLLKENSNLNSSLNQGNTRFFSFVDSKKDSFETHTSESLKRQEANKLLDFPQMTSDANRKVAIIQENLVKNGVVGRSFSDLDKIEGLVSAIQKDIPGVHKYANYEGSQAAAIIGGNQGQVILAYSRGITGSVLRRAEKFAAANPNSATAKFLSNNTKVFQAARRSIRQIENSKLSQNIYQAIGKGNQLLGVITNPIGALKSWAGRKAGEQIRTRLVEKIGNVVIKNAFTTLTKEGLKDGIKTLASKALTKMAAKAATLAAAKLGITISLSAVPVAGPLINIAIQAAIWLAEKTLGQLKKGLDGVWQGLGWGDEFRTRDLAAPLLIAGGTAITVGAAAFGGLIFIARTAQVAVVSAVGIIIGALVTVGLYLGFAYLVAPMLSTLVQFDAYEKVDYSEYGLVASPSGDCAWPTKGHYQVTTGPRGGTHRLSQLEAIDLYDPSINGTPLLSATSGVVIFTGVYSNYGNTVKIQTKNSAGSFVVIYGHLSYIGVGQGQQIAQGKQIGLVGGSGGWDPHIHLEYQGIKYNQCPAGGLKIKEECCAYDGPPICSGLCNATSN